jgi:ubiquinone/menaquinone biosynthesis C-methylase UbiE
METFVHFPNPQKAMNELMRLTKKGGMVIANATISGMLWRIQHRNWSFNLRSRNVLWYILRATIRRLSGSIVDQSSSSSKVASYWSRMIKPIRPILQNKFGTLETSIDRIPIVRPFSKQYFISLFNNAKLEVMKKVTQGSKYFPVFLIVSAKK